MAWMILNDERSGLSQQTSTKVAAINLDTVIYFSSVISDPKPPQLSPLGSGEDDYEREFEEMEAELERELRGERGTDTQAQIFLHTVREVIVLHGSDAERFIEHVNEHVV